MSTEKKHTATVASLFTEYVATNIIGQIGMSAYILVDTIFISVAAGSAGMAALNLVLPFFDLIFAFGDMFGVGCATRFTILRARGDGEADRYFMNSILWSVLCGIPFMLIGTFLSPQVIRLLGGDAELLEVGVPYMRVFMMFAPMFMISRCLNAFTRNDGAPKTAMAAVFMSGVFNIVFDYIFMFPMKLGMAGAALATGIAPIISFVICGTHLFSKKCSIRMKDWRLSGRLIVQGAQLGTASFIGDIASAMTMLVFNYLILALAGNVGVAAFGIISNIALVATSVFNGIAQGAQPLFSDFYGKRLQKQVGETFRLAIGTSLCMAVLFIAVFNLFPSQIVEIFNSEGNPEMVRLGITGIRLYFIGYLFAGVNIVGAGYLSATEAAMASFIVSIFRGVIAVIACALLMAWLFGMTGVWLAFTVAELLTTVLLIMVIRRGRK